MYTMRPAEFEYHRPTSLDEAISLLGEVEGSRAIAGGHSLLPMMKLRLANPPALVDLGSIPGLDGISGNGGLTIGALAPTNDTSTSLTWRGPARPEACSAPSMMCHRP